MAKFIDADKLLVEAKSLSGPQTGDGWDNWGVYALIERQPDADVRENVRGEWKHTEAYPHKVYCSVCFATYLGNEKWAAELPIKLHPNYCQNCGAYMRGVPDE